MAYKLYGRQVFRAEVNGQEYVFTCYGQDTSYGFRHICTEGFNNTTNCSYIKRDIIAKACYYNRTWEEFTYQTVLRKGIENLSAPKEVKEELNRILIKREADKRREQAEKEVKAFETLWNGLSEANKQHIRNGVGENGIQSKEQADMVVGVMKAMTAFQSLGL